MKNLGRNLAYILSEAHNHLLVQQGNAASFSNTIASCPRGLRLSGLVLETEKTQQGNELKEEWSEPAVCSEVPC